MLVRNKKISKSLDNQSLLAVSLLSPVQYTMPENQCILQKKTHQVKN